MKLVLLGASHSKGISGKTGKPYEIADIFYGKKPRAWTTDKGSCSTFGFDVGEDGGSMTFVVSDEILKQFESTAFPVLAETELKGSPDELKRFLHPEVKTISISQSA